MARKALGRGLSSLLREVEEKPGTGLDQIPLDSIDPNPFQPRKEFDEAIDQGKQAVEIAPDGIPGRKNLAYALINKGDRRAAVGVLRPLAQHDVQDPDVWRALAECFEALGDTNNAKLARTSQRRCEGKL